MTVYAAVGGDATFERIVELFYAGVERDPLLRPLYPDDLGPAKRHLTLFLIQFFGGHPTYSRLRGHPRLRARHLPFLITHAVRDAWVRNMTAALDQVDLPAEARAAMDQYFDDAATFLINRPE